MSFTSAGKPEFHYYIKDHLGSNRIVADENGNIEQKTHYYAYGGIIGDISTNPETQKYKYNGKENNMMNGRQTEHNEVLLQLLRYGGRKGCNP